MFFKRKLYDNLKEWKTKSAGRTALLIEGARRVGKSSLVEEFGRNEYRSFAIIDFFKASKAVKRVFEEESDDIDVMLKRLSAVLGIVFYPRETLIVFDEVQFYPKARGLIKYLVAHGRYDYIETGSLVSIKENVKDIVIPSEECAVRLNPMDFEEFLWALGDEASMSFLKECLDKRRPLGAGVLEKMSRRWREYMLVGGMPQSVAQFVGTRDFSASDEVRRSILALYRKDIAKAKASDVTKILNIFDSLPSQLSRPTGSKTYRLSELDKAARMREYENAFGWLEEAHIVSKCMNASDPSDSVLAKSKDSTTFKAFMCDTGLLVAHAFRESGFSGNPLYEAILDDRLGVNEGMLTENIVAQAFRATRDGLFYYARSGNGDREERMEVDFLIRRDGKTVPVEVKSGNYRFHSSLDKFRAKFGCSIGEPILLYGKDVMFKDGILHLPLCMASCL